LGKRKRRKKPEKSQMEKGFRDGPTVCRYGNFRKPLSKLEGPSNRKKKKKTGKEKRKKRDGKEC